MPDRIPTDADGELGLFPGSRVSDVAGTRQGVVIGARAQDVTVRWDGDKVEDVTGGNLRVTDDGIARPDGWTRNGARIPDVDELERMTAENRDRGDNSGLSFSGTGSRPGRPAAEVAAEMQAAQVDAEAEQLAIDVVNAVQESLPGLDAMAGMSPKQIERLVQKAAEKAMRDSLGRRRDLAQRMVATQPYQPGLLTTVMALLLGIIGFAVLALIKAIAWMLKRGNRDMAKDKLQSIAKAASLRAPEREKLMRLLDQGALDAMTRTM